MLNISDILDSVIEGDAFEVLREFPDNSVDAVITDPPYGLSNHSEKTIRDILQHWLNGEEDYIPNARGFMGKGWDAFVPPPALWRELYRVMKPGATALVFASSRTQDLMSMSLRLAGFEIKDVLMWLYGCVSEDTEILTTEGWKNYKNISEKDIVFSFDTKKHRIIKSKINKIFIYPYKGEMINLKNQNTDQLITPNHKVICKMGYRKQKYGKRSWYKEDEWVYRDAWQIRSNQYTLPLASIYDGEWSIGGDFAEVIGWVLSEGNYQKDCNAVNIYQSNVNPEKVARIRYCLNRAKIKYSEYQRKRKYKNREYIEYQWYISGQDAERIKEIIPDKKPNYKLFELKLSEKERLIKGLVEGDGSKNKNGKYGAFYQKDIKFLEWFQILLHLTGKQGWINYKKRSCSIHYNDSTQIQGKHNKNRVVQYNGIVWSINTDIGNYIARRNGKIFITGNSGFPKATDISKQIDKMFGAKRKKTGEDRKFGRCDSGIYNINVNNPPKMKFDKFDKPATPEAKRWEGYKSHALKPAYEPIIMAVKRNEGSYARNALKWGVAGLNISETRIGTTTEIHSTGRRKVFGGNCYYEGGEQITKSEVKNYGRFPANILLDEVSAEMLDEQSGVRKVGWQDKDKVKRTDYNIDIGGARIGQTGHHYADKGGASRFFYVAKASRQERNFGLEGMPEKQTIGGGGTNNKEAGAKYGSIKAKQCNFHPTVKPLKLLEYLVKLVKMPNKNQIILDPFLGSGTTAMACKQMGRHYIGIEKEHEYVEIARRRINAIPNNLFLQKVDNENEK